VFNDEDRPQFRELGQHAVCGSTAGPALPAVLNSFSSRLVALPRRYKRILLGIFDFLILSAALWLSYTIRLGAMFDPGWVQIGLLVAAPAIALPILYWFGFYQVVVRYVTEATVWTIVKGLGLSIPVWLGIAFMTELRGVQGVPRSIPVIYFVIGVGFLAGSRLLAKSLLGAAVESVVNQRRVLIYGAGSVGRQLAAALKLDPANAPLGFIDDDPALRGAIVAGLAVHGPDEISSLIDRLQAHEVIVCSDAVDGKSKTAILKMLSTSRVRIGFLPNVASGWGGDLVSRIRDIGLGDLLGRQTVAPDPALMSGPITGKTVLVTGAGGSIGSELCRQIVEQNPARIILCDLDEFALYEIERTFNTNGHGIAVPALGSVTDRKFVCGLFRTYKIDTVFHAAAYKHVPMVERNPIAGIVNNVFGTWNVAQAAYDAEVEHFVLISTDKAVRPTNVMGATKRWAEIIVRSFATRSGSDAPRRRFCAVRFGNVIGSQGSVVPLFKEQIARGGPVTLTDDNMTRYFMSVNEAVELIIQAASLSQSGEIFLLDMGEPVRIRDLAENMIRLAGLSVKDAENPDGDIAIETIGARPGEKNTEEMFYDPASVENTSHSKIMFGKRPPRDNEYVRKAMDALEQAVDSDDPAAACAVLFDFVREV
jgi:FlaA1/EpsC-like NDP-sugar epimerase